VKCPACDAEMVERHFGATIDICEHGCHGVWFDRDELMVVKRAGEDVNRELEQLQSRPPTRFRERGTLVCPRCQTPMQIRSSGSEPAVYIDECPTCGGVFLDHGEVVLVRESRPNIIDSQQRVAEMMVRESAESRRADERTRTLVELAGRVLWEIPWILLDD